MTGGRRGGELTAASVLSTAELSELEQQQQQQQQQQQGAGADSRDDVESAVVQRQQQQQQHAGGGVGVSRAYARGLWLALGLALLALAGTVGFQVVLMRERVSFAFCRFAADMTARDRLLDLINQLCPIRSIHHVYQTQAKEQRASLHMASGTNWNSTNALGMARAAQDRAIKLEQRLEGLELQHSELNATLLAVQAQAAATQAAADARFLAQCEALLLAAAQQEEEEQDKGGQEGAAMSMRTQYVCQAQAGWTLPCPGGATADPPTIIQALIGRFTSAPDGPCAEPVRPAAGQLALCPLSVDVTAQVRAAATRAGPGGPVARTPMQLLAETGRADPCPRAYKQLQVLYRCHGAASKAVLGPAARAERCRQALAAAPAGQTAGASGGAPAPGAAVTVPEKR